MMVLLPAFAVGQLKAAFLIGFLLFIPFLIVDLVVANVLLALGMHMLAPASGLVMALFQAGTRLTDPALALLPRVAAVFFALALSGPWIGEQLERFSRVLWQGIALIR